MRAVQQNSTVMTDKHLIGLYQVMQNHGDYLNAEKLIELYKKQQMDEYIISFAGHFSAGKSSMINALIGSDILPKSPIPTSANIVKLTSGEGVARVFFHQEDPIEYEEPYDLDMIKEYCKDKDTIKKIEISSSQDYIPINSAIIDTPGIDAADDTDRLITESSLHLVDVLFYVMDYNHVQSEVNLQFLRKIQGMHIPFYIIINQIDKHNDQELSFESFQNSVKQTFELWNLQPEAVYYSSLMEKHSTNSQFEVIKEKINNLLLKERILRIDASVNNLIDSHRTFLEDLQAQELSELSVNESIDGNVIEKIDQIMASIDELTHRGENLTKEYLEDLELTLKNAYLMPADVREIAQNFLESQQKDFKIGFLGSKKKTDEERTNRLDVFLARIEESMKASIEWKLRDKFSELLRNYSVTDQDLLSEVQQLSISIDADDVIGLIKKGAQVNGDYVLNYTNELSYLIKSKYRRSARELLSKISHAIEVENQSARLEFEKELANNNDQLKAHEQYQAIHEEYLERIRRVESQLDEPTYTIETEQFVRTHLVHQVFRRETLVINTKQTENLEEDLEETLKEDSNGNDATPSVQRVSRAIEETIQAVQDISGFESLINELNNKKERLENRELTIALFGAFSAGKSSFANALIGEGILPSSPNPTTAVINRIAPVTDSNGHGTVNIQLKEEKTLINDLVSILKHVAPPAFDNLSDLVNWIEEKEVYQNPDLSSMYQAYLKALLSGYSDHKQLLGQGISITLENFAAYVTDESKACYVESIDLHYDCSLTRKGITLVDTPGADSVNARHTNVAFDYIKDADAILYVTYYNHAITKADKDFVMQLGRVKESFQLDKMFFIINACDLAHDDTELALVMNYVKDQLLKLGIRHPRLYPVSSKQSLQEKLSENVLNDNMRSFENDFYSFLVNELSSLAVKSAIHDLTRTKKLLEHYSEKANLNEQEKQRYKTELVQKQKELLAVISSTEETLYEGKIQQKVDKQLHYVTERMTIRFHDMFKDKYNPTTVTESGKKAIRQIEKNMIDLLDYVGYELLQEVRAVSLRIEAYLNEQIVDYVDVYHQKLNKIDGDIVMPSIKKAVWTTPNYQQPLQDVDLIEFQKAFSLFRGTKAFFEKNEKEKMKESIYQILLPRIQQFVVDINAFMSENYLNQWNEYRVIMKDSMSDGINQYIESSVSLLSSTFDMDMLQNRLRDVQFILDKL